MPSLTPSVNPAIASSPSFRQFADAGRAARRARACEEQVWARLSRLSSVKTGEFVRRDRIPQPIAEEAALRAIEATLHYLAAEGKPLVWTTDRERESVLQDADRLYRFIATRGAYRDAAVARKRDGGSLDAPAPSGVAWQDLLADPRTLSRDIHHGDDERGGYFGRAVWDTLYDLYTPDEAARLWARFYEDQDWSEIATLSGKSVEAEKKWGNRQRLRLINALRERGALEGLQEGQWENRGTQPSRVAGF